MSVWLVPAIQFAQKLIPFVFNNKDETKFDINSVVYLVIIALLVKVFGPEATEVIIELSKKVG